MMTARTRLPALAALLTSLALAAYSSAQETVSPESAVTDPFPAAEPGQVRFVINLPVMPGPEEDFSVEVVAGRVIRTDGVNRFRMDAALESHPLPGWGYTYYVMTGTGQTASTLMAVPEGTEPVEAFVGGRPLTIPYSSRMPIVVYAAEGFEIRYRIWAAAERFIPANPG
jgi:ecotin